MDSFKLDDDDDIRVEKAKAIWRTQLIAFRVVELLVFVMIVSVDRRWLKVLGEYIRRISASLITPQSVFLIGNAIVILLLFTKSGQFSPTTDLYDEYLEKCQMNQQEKKTVNVCYYENKQRRRRRMQRSNSEKVVDHDRGRGLKRSMTEKVVDDRGRELTRSMTEKLTDEMSNEEFRRAVESFIARQQRFLREQ